MDNENLNPVPANQNDDWLDDILGKQNIPKELGPDELAVKAAGLKHPDEMDLDRIVQETLAEHWPEETPATTDTPAVSNESSDEDSTRQFAVVEETTPSEQPTAAEEEAPVTPVADPGLESQQDIMPSYHQYEDIISELTEQNQQEEDTPRGVLFFMQNSGCGKCLVIHTILWINVWIKPYIVVNVPKNSEIRLLTFCVQML